MWSTIMPAQLTLGSVLERALQQFAKTEIVTRRSNGDLARRTYRDLVSRSHAFAAALQRVGLSRGDRVGTLMTNSAEHLEAWFGATAGGFVAHPINIRLHPNDIAYVINHAADRVLVVDAALAPVIDQIRDRIEPEHFIVIGGEARGYITLDDFINDAGDFHPPSLHENEAAVLCYTTGTVGAPKGVVYSHRALVLHALALSLPDYVAVSSRDTVLPLVPMYHANAWGLPLAATLAGARQVYAVTTAEPACPLELFANERVSLSAAVPSVWNSILHELERHPEFTFAPNARGVVSGAAVPESLIRGFDARGLRLMQAWGLVESGPLATLASHGDERLAQGRPLPFIESRVQGDDRGIGEIQLRGPWVAASYHNLADQRGKWSEDGWFRTGDVGSIDENGTLHLADRAKDLIRIGDDWVSSADLEVALMDHPTVVEAAVIAVTNAQHQERPLALVVTRQGSTVTPDKIREHLAARFADWQLPDAFLFVDHLPHSPTGKLLKKELRKTYRNWPA